MIVTAWMITAALGGVAIIVAVVLQHRREVLSIRLNAPKDAGLAFDEGLEHAAQIAASLHVYSSGDRTNIVRAIRGAKRLP